MIKIVLDSNNFFVIIVSLIKGYFIVFLKVWIWKLKFVIMVGMKGILWSKLFVELIVNNLVIW